MGKKKNDKRGGSVREREKLKVGRNEGCFICDIY